MAKRGRNRWTQDWSQWGEQFANPKYIFGDINYFKLDIFKKWKKLRKNFPFIFLKEFR